MTIERDKKNGRSVYNKQFCKEENDVARKKNSVVTPGVPVRLELQLEKRC